MIDQDKYDVLLHPDDRLRNVAEPVAQCGPETTEIAERMLETMRVASGIGLAATQVGIDMRIIVADVSEEQNSPVMLANPKVVEQSKELNTHEEGCLSVPGVVAPIKRPAQVKVEAIDINFGKKVTIDADGLLATCLQHEIDHLDGILFFDHLTRLRRARLLRQYKKAQEESKEKERQVT